MATNRAVLDPEEDLLRRGRGLAYEPAQIADYRPESRALAPVEQPMTAGYRVRSGGRANPIQPGATINVPPSEYRQLPRPPRPLPPGGTPANAGAGYRGLDIEGLMKTPPVDVGGDYRGSGFAPGGGRALAAAGEVGGIMAAAPLVNEANKLASRYVDPGVASAMKALLPEHWADNLGEFGNVARMLMHLGTGGSVEDAGQFFTAHRAGPRPDQAAAVPQPVTTPAATMPTTPVAQERPRERPSGVPVDLAGVVQGRPAKPGLEGSTMAETRQPPGRVMGLDQVGPGQGYATLERAPDRAEARALLGNEAGPQRGDRAGGGPVTYEVTGGQVRKFQGGAEQPMGGTVSSLSPGYDKAAYAAEQARLAEDRGIQALWQAANAPVSTSGTFGQLKRQSENRKLAGELYKEAVSQRDARQMSKDKALWEAEAADAAHQRDLDKIDLQGEWNLAAAEVRKPEDRTPPRDSTGASTYGALENKFFQAAKSHGVEAAMQAYLQAAQQRGQQPNPVVIKFIQDYQKNQFGMGLLGPAEGEPPPA